MWPPRIVARLPLAMLAGVAVVIAHDGRAGAQTPQVACAGPDRILRVYAAAGCPSGQSPVPLAIGSAGGGTSGDNAASRDPGTNSRNTMTDLERRFDALLEKAATFIVVRDDGTPIMSVGGEGVRVFNAAGVDVADMLPSREGAEIIARSAAKGFTGTVLAGGESVGIKISDGRLTRLDLGRRAAGNYSFFAYNQIGAPVAAIGESRAGSGALQVNDEFGKTMVSMDVDGRKGRILVDNASGAGVLALTEGLSGGLLNIGNRAGDPVVKMGVKSGLYGVVLTGPAAGFPYVPRSGLPGSYMLGCAGGPACSGENVK